MTELEDQMIKELLESDAEVKTEMRGRLTSWKDIFQFVFAGKARFTLVSVDSGRRFTYRVTKKKPPENDAEQRTFDRYGQAYFVSLLRGPDNSSDYAYMGVIDNGGFKTTTSSRVSKDAESHVAFAWFLARMSKGGAPCTKLEFWTEGRCGRCGRGLTVPTSVNAGFGPECIGRLGE
jgi:hypothetical protein